MTTTPGHPLPLDATGATAPAATLDPSDTFWRRHLGPDSADIAAMLEALGHASLDDLTDAAIPPAIRTKTPLEVGPPRGEFELLQDLQRRMQRNRVMRSCIGMGYHDVITPPVILRNILENPCWYTQYTPYQAEIAQGRLEALLNFQTMVSDLTGLPLSGASLLDEATAAAEAMVMLRNVSKQPANAAFLIDPDCHPQTIEVVSARARALGIATRIEPAASAAITGDDAIFGVLVQYPGTNGQVHDLQPIVERVHAANGYVAVAADLLSLTLFRAPGEYGADVAVGTTQRFGVPMGFGGPHAAYIATHEAWARKLPGRLIGVSKDAAGRPAMRLAIQTREQHIKRDRATSNICTAQVLLAIIASMYAVYHGPDGLRRIAMRARGLASAFAAGLAKAGIEVEPGERFDTISVAVDDDRRTAIVGEALARGYNLRDDAGAGRVGVTFDETSTREDVQQLLAAFSGETAPVDVDALYESAATDVPETLARRSGYLTHEVFGSHHSETDMLRYITELQSRDLSLAHSMIALGSCTMKLNATSEMLPVTWDTFGRMHPFAPVDQTRGYAKLFRDLETWLGDITGFAGVSLQPNAGSQGEYTGLLVIRAYHESRGDHDRDVCLIPISAHGTNPASAVAAGFRVVTIGCDAEGNIDLADLDAKIAANEGRIGALMVTYPSTHGVFETEIKTICDKVHAAGGQVYLDGANLNAMVGLVRPGEIGADVCHLNLHKTFCIPHGGGGPGMGPIGVAPQLVPFLPGHSVRSPDHATDQAIPAISAAPYGSPSILPISWVYIALMGSEGLRRATQVAILNANYMAHRLKDHYDVLFTGPGGLCAHEFIIDCRPFDKSAGIKIDDLAKRLIDYGFHAPTMSWPVAGTLMIEPTESESKAELDRFCDAMIAIRGEIDQVASGASDREDNPLRNAPHTIEAVSGDEWTHPYSRQLAAWPLPYLRRRKFWAPVGRVDNPYGDRNLVCSCPPMETYASE
ncbi:MAG: aminomethyl-transferring glycine dehydrogenase [Phycisphaerales bacterium]